MTDNKFTEACLAAECGGVSWCGLLLAGLNFGGTLKTFAPSNAVTHNEHFLTSSVLTQGHGQRRATCYCTQATEVFTVNIKDFQRILRPLQQGSHQSKMQFLRQASFANACILKGSMPSTIAFV